MRFVYWVYLSEKGTVEGHSVETVDCPHGNVQVHQKSLLLQSVNCSANPLETQVLHTGLFQNLRSIIWIS